MEIMKTAKEILLVYGRIITVFPLLFLATMFMGKRSIGELPVFDFLIIISLGAVVGADIADPRIEHIHTGFTIVALALLQRFVSGIIIRHRKVGKLLTFEPTIVVIDGIFQVDKLRKIRYSLDNILQMLREKDIFDVSLVQLAVVEANGKISVYKKDQKNTPTKEDLNVQSKSTDLSYPVILDGRIDCEVLQKFNVDQKWLEQELNRLGFSNPKEVFFAAINRDLKLHASPTHHSKKAIPFKH